MPVEKISILTPTHPTGRGNEWEVISYMNNDLLGEMRSQWMIRSDRIPSNQVNDYSGYGWNEVTTP